MRHKNTVFHIRKRGENDWEYETEYGAWGCAFKTMDRAVEVAKMEIEEHDKKAKDERTQ